MSINGQSSEVPVVTRRCRCLELVRASKFRPVNSVNTLRVGSEIQLPVRTQHYDSPHFLASTNPTHL